MGKLIRWFGRTMMPNSKCSEEDHCMELARLMLDDESTPENDAYVLKHIDGCYRCYDNYNVEQAIREAVKHKCTNIEIPQEVVEEIREKINVD